MKVVITVFALTGYGGHDGIDGVLKDLRLDLEGEVGPVGHDRWI